MEADQRVSEFGWAGGVEDKLRGDERVFVGRSRGSRVEKESHPAGWLRRGEREG